MLYFYIFHLQGQSIAAPSLLPRSDRIPTGSLKLHLIYCNLIYTAQTGVILYLHISYIMVLFPLCKLSDSTVMNVIVT